MSLVSFPMLWLPSPGCWGSSTLRGVDHRAQHVEQRPQHLPDVRQPGPRTALALVLSVCGAHRAAASVVGSDVVRRATGESRQPQHQPRI